MADVNREFNKRDGVIVLSPSTVKINHGRASMVLRPAQDIVLSRVSRFLIRLIIVSCPFEFFM